MKKQNYYTRHSIDKQRFTFWFSLITILALIYDLGYDQSAGSQKILTLLYALSFSLSILSTVIRYLNRSIQPRIPVMMFDLLSVLFLCIVLYYSFSGSTQHQLGSTFTPANRLWTNTAVFLVFVREFSVLTLDFKRTVVNPAQLFIFSFILIILVGTFLLLLPNSTVSSISFMDALFTSTSAVCVTGLIVVDTGSHFTNLGQTIILILIQIGGLGIMTFASYFSYFFSGGSSYENTLMLSDIISSKKIGEVFSTLKQIILVTFIIEGLGAAIIFFSVTKNLFTGISEQLFFSVFHSISAFCNAGFSTLPNSLYELPFRFNYPLHLVIALLFTIGGIGFPIVFNLVLVVKEKIVTRVLAWLKFKEYSYTPWLLNLNSRIVIITSAILIISGTILFFALEYNNTLAEHRGFGKLVTAFFGATTPRTAGFNTVDISSMKFSTIMIIFLLMWIGASPGSTGGGIKTSTIAIATLNFLSLAKGKTRVEIFRRKIANISIRRAFAIISLSLVVIGMAIFCIATFDSEKDLLGIAFECFSAYSTVGLSTGITASLSEYSKGILIGVMFVGRVSMLTLLIALLPKEKYKAYQYPSEEIFIN